MKRYIQSILFTAGAFGLVAATASADAYACKGEGKKMGHGARLMKMDVDQNGVLDRSELTNGMYKRAEMKLQRSDANKDGYLEQSELGKHRKANKVVSEEKRAKFAARSAERFQKVDTNGDGRLALAELHTAADARVNKMIEKLDKNGDGSIGGDELPARGRKHQKNKKSE